MILRLRMFGEGFGAGMVFVGGIAPIAKADSFARCLLFLASCRLAPLVWACRLASVRAFMSALSDCLLAPPLLSSLCSWRLDLPLISFTVLSCCNKRNKRLVVSLGVEELLELAMAMVLELDELDLPLEFVRRRESMSRVRSLTPLPLAMVLLSLRVRWGILAVARLVPLLFLTSSARVRVFGVEACFVMLFVMLMRRVVLRGVCLGVIASCPVLPPGNERIPEGEVSERMAMWGDTWLLDEGLTVCFDPLVRKLRRLLRMSETIPPLLSCLTVCVLSRLFGGGIGDRAKPTYRCTGVI